MTRLHSLATVYAPCSWCLTVIRLSREQAISKALGEACYCTRTCRNRAYIDRASAHSTPCQVCGGQRGRHRYHELEICYPCSSLAWRSCWRKYRYDDDPGTIVHPDGLVLRPYDCDLCTGWHISKMAADVVQPAEYLELRARLADLIRTTGFNIDQHRDRTPFTIQIGQQA